MKFCTVCGSSVTLRIPEGDNRERHVCPNCGTIHYQNPRIITGTIPTHGDRVLLCRRAIEPRHGLWTLPAGFLENGETVLEGALRESEEEANARLVNPELSCVYDIPHINQVYMLYRGELKDLDFSPGIESLDVELFREDEIPWEDMAFTVMKKVLRHYFSDLNVGQHQLHTGTILRPGH